MIYNNEDDNPANWKEMPRQYRQHHERMQSNQPEQCSALGYLSRVDDCKESASVICDLCSKSYCSYHAEITDNEITREYLDTDTRFTDTKALVVCAYCIADERMARREP